MLFACAILAVGWTTGVGRVPQQGVRAVVTHAASPRFAPEGARMMAIDPYAMDMSEMELAEQAAKLDALNAKWSKRQQREEADAAGRVGWVAAAQITNGRFAMFFLPVGLITEYYTGESMPQQVYTLLRTLSIVEVRARSRANPCAARADPPPRTLCLCSKRRLRAGATSAWALV